MVELSVRAMLRTCARGLAPPNAMVKSSGLICVNTDGPTVTATGMVTLSPEVWNSNWPIKVPFVEPPPGSWALLMLIAMVEGAVPLEGVAVSQLPPSAVLVVKVQFNVPDPEFRIWIDCAVGVPLVLREKLSFPGRSSKNVAPEAATVSVTGMVMLMVPLAKLV